MNKISFKSISILIIIFFVYSCKDVSRVPVPVIFDTDMGPDYDDVGALTVLHALADSGEAKILATMSSNMYAYTGPCIDVINHYYGRPDIPVGSPRKGVTLEDVHKEKWAEALPAKFPHKLNATKDAEDAVVVYRRVLAAQPDTSVTIITVGFFTNLAALLQSPADNVSGLNGTDLVKKKVKYLVSMAGSFPKGREFNVFCDSVASQVVFDKWPSPVVLSGFEIGKEILTGKDLVASNVPNSPAKEAFTICLKQDDPAGRMSWDQTAVLVGVRGADKYFGTVRGHMITSSDGSNSWRDDPAGMHQYLVWKTPAGQITKIIEDLMMHQPVKK